MYFDGSSYLEIPSSPDFVLDTDTPVQITWEMYKTDNRNSPRLFSIAAWPDTELGVSLEQGGSPERVMVWYDGNNFTATNADFAEQVRTYAIVRNSSGVTSIFEDGVRLIRIENTNLGTDSSAQPLLIGCQAPGESVSFFGGYLRNFHIMIGGATIDPESSTCSTTPPDSNSFTKLLLSVADEATALEDQGPSERTVTVHGVTWVSSIAD